MARVWRTNLVPLSASVGWLVFASLSVVQEAPARDKVNFGRDILPILSDKCFKCHGPDPSSRMAAMRLDTPEGAFANRGGRWPIVPGKPEHSMILERIHHATDPMPPPSSGKSLTQREKDLIRQWIVEGAQYTKLWSFEPLPAKVLVPQVGQAWAKDDLDRFVWDRMNRSGLKPSPPASDERWLRRVTLDLTGLPPTEEEIADFASNSGNRWRVVARLLDSPHFGERMAVEWLDAARYGDSYGYQSDLLMPMWPYRDWVVRAFNENLPYNQFLTEQIAGDLLPNPTRDQVLATAFNRLHRQSNEGGSIAKEFKTEYAVDRVSTFGTAVLGLTLACARCHDHKFDPITQREFYQLYAYFNSIEEYGLLLSTEIVPTPSLLLPSPEQESKLRDLRKASDDAWHKLTRAKASSSERFGRSKPVAPMMSAQFSLDALEDGKYPSQVAATAHGQPIGKLETAEGLRGKAPVFDGDNGLAIKGLPARERWETFTWSFWVSDPRQKSPVVLLHRTGGTDVGFCGFDLTLEDGALTARVMRHWPGNAVAIRTTERVPKDQWAHLGWSWDGSGRASGLKLYVNGRPMKSKVVVDSLWKKIGAYGDLGGSGGDWCFGQRFRDAGFKGGMVDDVAFASRELGPSEVAHLYKGTSQPMSEGALKQSFFYSGDPVADVARRELAKAQESLATFEESLQEISVMAEAKPPIPAHVLARGQYDAPTNNTTLVRRGVPVALPPLRARKNDRLALAKWSTSPNHPLTARVAVNRLWQMLFGTGLVETSENFGVQGSPPSHPELLDFLSRRFVDEGWDVKKTLARIVLSATYSQDSSRRSGEDPDPGNRLLSRGPSARLSAEMIRDLALSASRLLNDKLGGPPVNPYQPAGIWQENNTMSPGFVQSKGTDLYRRSLYSTWKRTTPVPSMMLFDATSREACTVRRPSTNTPLQALVLLNDVQFVEAARALADLAICFHPTADQRIQWIFLSLASRLPDDRERAVLLRTLGEQRAMFAAAPADAAKLIAIGESKPTPDLDPVELAATTVVAQTILNSDAVVWKR